MCFFLLGLNFGPDPLPRNMSQSLIGPRLNVSCSDCLVLFFKPRRFDFARHGVDGNS